jgi:hypothetical protein
LTNKSDTFIYQNFPADLFEKKDGISILVMGIQKGKISFVLMKLRLGDVFPDNNRWFLWASWSVLSGRGPCGIAFKHRPYTLIISCGSQAVNLVTITAYINVTTCHNWRG